MRADLPALEPMPRYPAVQRDLALVVDASLPAGRVLDAIEATRGGAHDAGARASSCSTNIAAKA